MKQLKRITALFAVLLMCLQPVPAVYAQEKTETAFVIASADDFVQFAENCTRDIWSKDITVELTKDINLSSRKNCMVPYFQGHFIGNGHTISGVKIEKEGSKLGLFRTLTEAATVENLVVEGTVNVQGSAENIGLLAGVNHGLITDCRAKGKVFANARAGGIVGLNEQTGKIINSVGDIQLTGETDAGGIAGKNLGLISGCRNQGTVNQDESQKAPMNMGGIAGRSEGLIEKCRNTGDVGYPHIGYNVGGIVGLQNGETRDCTNTAAVNGRKDVGGITGQLEPSMDMRSSPSPFESINAGMDAFIQQLGRYSDQLNAMAQQGNAGGQVVHGSLEEIQKETSEAGSRFSDDLKQISDDLENAGSDLKKVVETLRDGLKSHTEDWSEGTQNLVNRVDGQVEIIQNQLSASLNDLNSGSEVLRSISGEMSESLHQVRQGIRQLGDAPQLTVKDESASITEGPGVISGCSANTSVSGDSNVGGIVGTMSVEVQDDPETTMVLEDISLLADTTVHLQAVVRNCEFKGAVNAKNDCAGGIAGRSEAGAIADGIAMAGVKAGTEYCGGIAGKIKGSVVKCAAQADLSAAGWIGGIAGSGNNISDCVTMIRIENEEEFCGAIAGQTEGELSNNFYLLEGLAGLDGVDYEGKAQGVIFDEFKNLKNVPDEFLKFSYRFVADGRTMAVIPFEYGGDLDESQIPPAPVIKNKCGLWPEFPTKGLQRSLVLRASFEEPAATISWGGEPALLLAEGRFTHDAKLEAEEIEQPNLKMEDMLPKKAYQYQVAGSRDETITLRLRSSEAEYPAVAIRTGSSWQKLDAQADGSYLVLKELPLEGEIVLLQGKKAFSREIIFTAAAAGLVLIAALVRKRHKHKK